MSRWLQRRGYTPSQRAVRLGLRLLEVLSVYRRFGSEKELARRECGMQRKATYKVMSIFKVARNSHLSCTVPPWDMPFAPVESVHAPWGQIVAVGGHTVGVAKEISWAWAFVVHVRVRSRSDVCKAQRGVRSGARGRRWVVLLGRGASSVLWIFWSVGERNVLLVWAQASGTGS
jgi:hypothetical protein